jgi:hypothetical protein
MRQPVFTLLMILLTVFFHERAWGSEGKDKDIVDDCNSWLQDNKILASDPDCSFKCLSAPVDMGTFLCHEACDRACKKPKTENKKCQISPFWKDRLNGPTSPFRPLNESEREHVNQALSRIPESWRPKALKSIVKASAQYEVSSLASPATSSSEYIILFPRAFTLEQSKVSRVLTHEIMHLLIESEWSQNFSRYKKDFGWPPKALGESPVRSGSFIEPDAKFSPEEDMVKNLEYFIFEPSTLKTKCPEIFAWIQKRMAPLLKLQNGCAK